MNESEPLERRHMANSKVKKLGDAALFCKYIIANLYATLAFYINELNSFKNFLKLFRRIGLIYIIMFIYFIFHVNFNFIVHKISKLKNVFRNDYYLNSDIYDNNQINFDLDSFKKEIIIKPETEDANELENTKRALQVLYTTYNFSKGTSEKLTEFTDLGFFHRMRNSSYFGETTYEGKNRIGDEDDIEFRKVYLVLYSKPKLISITKFKLEFILLIQAYNKWIYYSYDEEFGRNYNLDVTEEEIENTGDGKYRGKIKFSNNQQKVMLSLFSNKAVVSGYMPLVNLDLEFSYILNKDTSEIESITEINGRIAKSNKQSASAYKTADLNTTVIGIDYSFKVYPERREDGTYVQILDKINLFNAFYLITNIVFFTLNRTIANEIMISPLLVPKVSSINNNLFLISILHICFYFCKYGMECALFFSFI